MIFSPCLNCTKRQPACHSSCDEYKDYRKKLDELNALIKSNRNHYHREKGSWKGAFKRLKSN